MAIMSHSLITLFKKKRSFISCKLLANTKGEKEAYEEKKITYMLFGYYRNFCDNRIDAYVTSGGLCNIVK